MVPQHLGWNANQTHGRSSLLRVSTNHRRQPSSYSTSFSSYPVDGHVISVQSTILKATLETSVTRFPRTPTRPSSSSILSAQTLAARRGRHKNGFIRFKMHGQNPQSAAPLRERFLNGLVSRRKRREFCLPRTWLARDQSLLPLRCCIARLLRATAMSSLMEFGLLCILVCVAVLSSCQCELIQARSCHHDGYGMAPLAPSPGLYSTFCQCHCECALPENTNEAMLTSNNPVLRISFHVLHGRCLRARLP